MAKNVQPGAKGAAGPGKGKAPVDLSSSSGAAIDQTSSTVQQDQLANKSEAAGAGQGLSDAETILSSSTGNQDQPGTPAAGSAADSELVPPGAAPSSFAALLTERIHGLAVTSHRDGFWRAGHQWTKAEQHVPVADFTEAQLRQILEERLLTVRYVDLALVDEGGE